MTESATPVPAPKPLTFWQQIELALEKFIHPEAKAACADIAAALENGKTAWLQEFQASGMTLAAYLEGKASSLVNAQPILAPFAGFILPLVGPFISKEIGYGETDLGVGIDKLSQFFVSEESNV